jgi:hypothetical protein
MFIDKTYKSILTALLIVLLAGAIHSCCLESDKHYYFPEEAIIYYNTNDTITYKDMGSGEEEKLVVCLRDTFMSYEEVGGVLCSVQVYFYTAAYFLDLDSCNGNPNFIIHVKPNNYGRVIWIYNDSIVVNHTFTYEKDLQFDIELLGKKYYNVVKIEDQDWKGAEILFNLEYGLIQYSTPDSIVKTLYHEN